MIRDAQAVRDVFAQIACTYRAVNRVLTFGLDGHWRRQAARRAMRSAPASALDVCTGTGEMAACLRRAGRGRVSVTAVDFCEAMLGEAVRRSSADGIMFQRADAARLPFPDESFDVVTISFALRNLNVTGERFATCLGECRRVLRRGGRLVTVETTRPPTAFVRRIMHSYVGTVVPRLGAFLSKSRPAYSYLSGTISRFHSAPECATILRDAGFGQVEYSYLTFGLVAIHEAVKGAGDALGASSRIVKTLQHDKKTALR